MRRTATVGAILSTAEAPIRRCRGLISRFEEKIPKQEAAPHRSEKNTAHPKIFSHASAARHSFSRIRKKYRGRYRAFANSNGQRGLNMSDLLLMSSAMMLGLGFALWWLQRATHVRHGLADRSSAELPFGFGTRHPSAQ